MEDVDRRPAAVVDAGVAEAAAASTVAAVGEGSVVVSSVHQVLAEH